MLRLVLKEEYSIVRRAVEGGVGASFAAAMS
jgi:hypothetical protein